jgi:hypothetical protein
MPKYHFHLDDERDEQGVQLDHLAAAKCEALVRLSPHLQRC